jgi:hypothetical protein
MIIVFLENGQAYIKALIRGYIYVEYLPPVLDKAHDSSSLALTHPQVTEMSPTGTSRNPSCTLEGDVLHFHPICILQN